MEKAERLVEKKVAKRRKLREVKAQEFPSTTAGGAQQRPFLRLWNPQKPRRRSHLLVSLRVHASSAGNLVTGRRNARKRE